MDHFSFLCFRVFIRFLPWYKRTIFRFCTRFINLSHIAYMRRTEKQRRLIHREVCEQPMEVLLKPGAFGSRRSPADPASGPYYTQTHVTPTRALAREVQQDDGQHQPGPPMDLIGSHRIDATLNQIYGRGQHRR
jgi:hypothetical protein